MLRQEEIALVIDSQQEYFQGKDQGLIRESLSKIPIVESFATIITGLRRCGKSTLLLQLMNQKNQNAIYLNFEDIRLIAFEPSDFPRLYSEIKQRAVQVIFFDEVQLIEKWEIFVNQLLREGFFVFVTGSNASLLSGELGTHLTGRHLSMELFPFSYQEFISFTSSAVSYESLEAYLKIGGIPEFVKSKNELIIAALLDDILVKDIAVRHGIRDVASLKQLALYLLSNLGVPTSANKLVGMFGIKSAVTILDFFSYFQNSYLMDFVPQFSYSLKAQNRNPKKVYALDLGLATAVSTSFSENNGRKLENLIYLHLRRKYNSIHYFTEKGECDFVVSEKGKVTHAIQVCYQISDENFSREYKGLLQALDFFNLEIGWIVTANQRDRLEESGKTVELIPAFEFITMEL
uniref:ATP-binding protein n=1 Tax=Algoriphagus sp. TaxID=1872435 RepID=UPI002582D242|nr:ATP-binding protein [Algoriphagus sp.]